MDEWKVFLTFDEVIEFEVDFGGFVVVDGWEGEAEEFEEFLLVALEVGELV